MKVKYTFRCHSAVYPSLLQLYTIISCVNIAKACFVELNRNTVKWGIASWTIMFIASVVCCSYTIT